MNFTINAFEIRGESLKSTICSSEGVLVHDGENVIFIPTPMNIIKVHKPIANTGSRKVVFASPNFDKIQMLNDNENYIVWIAKDIINIHRAGSYEFVMSIKGRTF
jgi:hypothetical protein